MTLDLTDVANALTARPTMDDRHWMASSLTDLCAYIVEQHHTYTKRELPRLAALAAKVHLRHGHMYPELHQICECIEALNAEIGDHMLKEEEVLFPRLKALEDAAQSGIAPRPAFFGSMLNPVHHMMSDHSETVELLHSIRALTRDYRLPESACLSYQELYQGLSDLERDLHQHIHLEDNVLFPRALEIEASS